MPTENALLLQRTPAKKFISCAYRIYLPKHLSYVSVMNGVMILIVAIVSVSHRILTL